tara:strand:+ start:3462 stop:3908 length:447 start_codon:yes stop_codon:yes gene_type:complete
MTNSEDMIEQQHEDDNKYSLIPTSFKKRHKDRVYLKRLLSNNPSIDKYLMKSMPILNHVNYDERHKYGENENEIRDFNLKIIRRTMSRRRYVKIIISKICARFTPGMVTDWLEENILSLFGCFMDEELFTRKYKIKNINRECGLLCYR